MHSLLEIVATQRILVAAAPVTSILSPPFVVSALRAKPHDGVLSMTVVAEFTSTVVPAEPSRRISPSIFHAADAVPADACCRATMVPWKA